MKVNLTFYPSSEKPTPDCEGKTALLYNICSGYYLAEWICFDEDGEFTGFCSFNGKKFSDDFYTEWAILPEPIELENKPRLSKYEKSNFIWNSFPFVGFMCSLAGHMNKLKLIYKLSPIFFLFVTFFACYFAYNCWQDERFAVEKANKAEAKYEKYIQDNNEVKKIESNIIEAIKNGYAKTDALRNDIDNGLVELRIKVESVERDSTTAGNAAIQALRLAKSSQQDYYNLTNAIEYNKAIIEGWQKYYCNEIAPKNNTEFMCKN